jgi:thymidylate kinase
MIVAIEGASNTGKTTFAKLIHDGLQSKGLNASLISGYANDDVVYDGISKITNPLENNIDKNSELFLYAASLARKSYLCCGEQHNFDVVILDRFTGSFSAYFSSANIVNKKLLKRVYKYASCGIVVDICLNLRVGLPEIVLRSESSPLSRKDLNIEEYFDQYNDQLRRHCRRVSREYYEVDAELGVAPHVNWACELIDEACSSGTD